MKHYNNCIISKDALLENVKKVRKVIGDKVLLCAMVKANAYGHGLREIVRAAGQTVDFFGVATPCEAKQVREVNRQTRVLITGITRPEEVLWCSKNNVSVTLGAFNELKQFEKKLKNNVLRVHIKLNTGLNRLGISSCEHLQKVMNYIKSSHNFIIEGIFTHFATKEKNREFTQVQYERFCSALKGVDCTGIILHCCNTYATLNLKQMHLNMVRCGFCLYGWQKGFSPVMRIESKILALQTLGVGDTIGYDQTFVCKKPCKVAVVAIGYGDGFDRRNSNRAHLIIGGKRCKVLGLVCMDVLMVDVSHVAGVFVGQTVLVLGQCGKNVLSPQYYANLLKTSPYEVLLKFNHRRMNIYLR